ncbi:leucyl/phenylalanyl-tRNA--protein transferase [Propionivibrio limicola]|uniref:leucyl/phenylalanyl-tRNA--protein transferase n=1 Tax=Propionivibrio limicola TaxID=167645 RepID=UPI0012919318|nr:leucyl/phenylalanyl-tRNA--protein transferase [Propionivibrio limicola]
MIPWLESNGDFPPLEGALHEPNGLLCAGGELSPHRLIAAYRHGVFPWYAKGEPILWWSPDPRMVLVPSEFKLSRSLRKTLRNTRYEVRLDYAFPSVIYACAKTRRSGQSGTWITTEMQAAYIALHELGHAHSVETWIDGHLVGGLYGLSIGAMFYGESMFAHVTDASKIALAHLARLLDENGFGLIDCQMNTSHLASLGGREIPRREFIDRLRTLTAGKPRQLPPCGRWPVDAAQRAWD